MSNTQASVEDAKFNFTPQNSNSAAATTQEALLQLPPTTALGHTPQPYTEVKQHLKLPNTSECWEEANSYFKTSLVSAVMAATSPEEKSRILLEGVYTYFAKRYGTKKIRMRERISYPPHNSALKEVKRKKNEARKELRVARKQGLPSDAIQSIARKFFSYVRSHSHLKRYHVIQQKPEIPRKVGSVVIKIFVNMQKKFWMAIKPVKLHHHLIKIVLTSSLLRYTMLPLGTMSSQHGCLLPSSLMWRWIAACSLLMRLSGLLRRPSAVLHHPRLINLDMLCSKSAQL